MSAAIGLQVLQQGGKLPGAKGLNPHHNYKSYAVSVHPDSGPVGICLAKQKQRTHLHRSWLVHPHGKNKAW